MFILNGVNYSTQTNFCASYAPRDHNFDCFIRIISNQRIIVVCDFIIYMTAMASLYLTYSYSMDMPVNKRSK